MFLSFWCSFYPFIWLSENWGKAYRSFLTLCAQDQRISPNGNVERTISPTRVLAEGRRPVSVVFVGWILVSSLWCCVVSSVWSWGGLNWNVLILVSNLDLYGKWGSIFMAGSRQRNRVSLWLGVYIVWPDADIIAVQLWKGFPSWKFHMNLQ